MSRLQGKLTQTRTEITQNNPTLLVDLSDLCSQVVGRQCPQTANYRVVGLKASIRNVDDSADNDRGAVFQGVVGWKTPTSHQIDAIQAHRAALREASADDIDSGLGILSTTKNYSGFRFGLNGANQVRYQSNLDDITGYATASEALGGTNQSMANMVDMFRIWEAKRTS